MGIWRQFWDWVKSIFKKSPEERPDVSYASRYEDITGENVTATIANALSTKAFGDSSLTIDGDGRRAEFIRAILTRFWTADTGWITAQALGKGGMVLIPTVTGGRVLISATHQERYYVSARVAGVPVSATILAEILERDSQTYLRWMDYTLEPTGVQTIKTVITNAAGGELPLSSVPEWANITPEVVIGNTDRLLLAMVQCPRDNRTQYKTFGVPITYGAEREIDDLVNHMNTYRREFDLKRAMLGLDESLWREKGDTALRSSPLTIDAVNRTVQDSNLPFVPTGAMSLDGKAPWQIYAPAIYQSEMHGRMVDLQRAVERACGLSQGVLTDRQQLSYANKDEIRAAQGDTFAVICDIREQWEQAFDDLAYAIDVFAERFGLTPQGARGSFTLAIDWDSSMMESTTQAYEQLREGRADKVISRAEHRQWIKGGTIEEAEKAIAKIDEEEPGMSAVLQTLGANTEPAPGADDGSV